MNQCNRIATRLFLYLSPLAMAVFLSEYWDTSRAFLNSRLGQCITAPLFVAWVFAGVWFFLGLVFSSSLRETVLTKLANLQERDEREERIVGYASRQTFLLMLGVLLALFAASTVRYGESVRHPSDRKYQTLTIGHFDLFEASASLSPQTLDEKREEPVRFYDLPLSKSGLLLLLIVLQLVAFRISAKKAHA